ncbi:hypothetical protein AJ80_03865 [Polytolypa hystricis UAMH7299]|uniref:Helicase ATP-binding domain-containing protein n=1 Tax=Polytolypa hystricis (strain UAMH7299) TaxID=1447883 RepID=A0A2B7YEA9_POLH7|nr:hypothetical protein AJ80_03865 [Polytolypa hystricis UAMH7299]
MTHVDQIQRARLALTQRMTTVPIQSPIHNNDTGPITFHTSTPQSGPIVAATASNATYVGYGTEPPSMPNHNGSLQNHYSIANWPDPAVGYPSVEQNLASLLPQFENAGQDPEASQHTPNSVDINASNSALTEFLSELHQELLSLPDQPDRSANLERHVFLLFFDEYNNGDDSDDDTPILKPPTNSLAVSLTNATRPPTMSARERRRNTQAGFELFNRANGKKTGARDRKRKPAVASRKPKLYTKKWLSKNGNGNMFTSNIIAQAKKNASKASIPIPKATSQARAFKELQSGVPNADKKAANRDKNKIKEAASRFSKRPRLNGKGAWIHPDIITSLFHHQVLGVAFMRQREASPGDPPAGGLLCDTMGFGKTIQALANIADDTPAPGDHLKTTLIVVPSHLVRNWMDEIERHFKPGVFGKILCQCPGSRIDGLEAEESIQSYGIVITTYNEVLKSCPVCNLDPPSACASETDDGSWFTNHFYENCGPLHRVKFRRIILDEAHQIKNYQARTSVAIRSLSAKYRWVMSGTPIHNGTDELYPYFDFLRVPWITGYENFCETYCQANDLDYARLVNMLRSMMLRRTLEDTIFGYPILTLPDIDEQTIYVRFSRPEKFLYREVIELFMSQILADPKSSYNQSTMLLRLRMFTSHVLLAQVPLKTLLDPDMLATFRAFLGDEPLAEDLEVFENIKKLMAKEPLLGKQLRNYYSPMSTTEDSTSILDQFRQILTSMPLNQQNEMRDKASCEKCKCQVHSAYVTQCHHLLCIKCYRRGAAVDPEFVCGCNSGITGAEYCRSLSRLIVNRNTGSRGYRTAKRKNHTIVDEMDGDTPMVDWVMEAGHLMPGAKLTATRETVKNWLKQDSTTKIVIFTQFLGMVHILGEMCDKERWQYSMLTGRMSLESREREVARFRGEPNVRILIVSMKLGGIGLNFTVAWKCILIDLWWNEAIEQQAFSRIFRIGQKRDIEVVRIAVQNSIDDRLQDIQSMKNANIGRVMGSEARSIWDTNPELMRLFGVVQDPSAERGFAFE